MRVALDALRDNGDEEFGTYLAALLAGLLAKANRLAEAEDLLAAALARVERTGERCFECELQRCYAAVLLRSGREREAEAMLRRAIATAREQETPFWELRATLDLARLWQERGELDVRRTCARRFAAASA